MLSQNRAILLALSLGFLTVTLDTSALSVALPAIRSSFHGSLTELQWVSNGYVLAFAGCILSAGRLADRFGPRTMFMMGIVGLAVSSLLCAVTPALGVLVLARILQGVAGAILATSSYALLAHTFENGPQRSKAFATLNFSGSIGLSGGPVVGGFLIETVGWRSIFLLNVCVAIVLFLALRFIDENNDSTVLTLDVPGQLLSIFMLTGLATALIQGRSGGWFGFAGLCALATVAFFVAFVATEHRSANPMLPLVLFHKRAFSAGTAIIGLWRCSLYGLMFFLALYFQNVNGYSSLRTGLAFLPITAGPLITNALSAPLSNRFGPRIVAVIGMTFSALGGVVLYFANDHPSYLVIAVGLFLMGAGAGAGIPAVGNIALSDAPKSHVGVASGVFNSGGQTGSLIGVAVIGGFAKDITDSSLHSASIVVTLALGATVILSARFLASSQQTANGLCN